MDKEIENTITSQIKQVNTIKKVFKDGLFFKSLEAGQVCEAFLRS